MRQENTREKLIEQAEEMIRTKGYSAFSYADLSEKIGIRKASIHHHFPSKKDLGVAVAEAAGKQILQRFAEIEQAFPTLKPRLDAYLAIFADRVRLPMCGALAADTDNLPEELAEQNRRHFQIQRQWLAKILNEAVAGGEIAPCDADGTALMVLNLCEGAALVARALKDMTVFEQTGKQLQQIIHYQHSEKQP